ncbi:MAG TPA: metallophosphoesterase [Candidatus Saccharimonadales bacterium]|nr:metallophosphoesterase [Candidatus Saccharimonadales bacterium]
MRSRFAIIVAIAQTILFLGHWFIYETWVSFSPYPASHRGLKIAFVLLSVSFLSGWMVADRSTNLLARVVYISSVVWLGMLSFSLLAAVASWITLGLVKILSLAIAPQSIAFVFFGLALMASLYGMLNAAWTRITRVSVTLPNLPESWRGRVAALVSDTHLGHVRSHGFLRRIVNTLNLLGPDVVFITGDMFDGQKADLHGLALLWSDLVTPLGSYFIAGNHDGFTGHARHLEAIANSGVRVLNNEKVELDGMQLLGIHYRDAVDPRRFKAILQHAEVDRSRASILLTHAPHGMHIAEEQGISLQLAGHTHGGQFFPFTWIITRVWGQFAYGLKRLGNLLVYTSSGAGTWGPPMRVGSTPEIVLIQFE